MKIKIFGSSDDLVVIDGDLKEEFNGDNGFLGFSEGTILHVKYTIDGIWRITPVKRGTCSYEKITEIVTHDIHVYEEEEYSDVVTLEGDIKWIMWGDTIKFSNNRSMSVSDYEDE